MPTTALDAAYWREAQAWCPMVAWAPGAARTRTLAFLRRHVLDEIPGS